MADLFGNSQKQDYSDNFKLIEEAFGFSANVGGADYEEEAFTNRMRKKKKKRRGKSL